jgi:hypothetical protein
MYSFYRPCDLSLVLQSAILLFVINDIKAAVTSLHEDELTFTAGAAIAIHQLRRSVHDIADYDFHVSQEVYDRIKQLNPQLEVKHCSLGESLNGKAGENGKHAFTIFCLGDIETTPLVFREASSLFKVFNLHQLKAQKWQLLKMWDRPWKKKIQDIKDLLAIREGFKYWSSAKITVPHTASRNTFNAKA